MARFKHKTQCRQDRHPLDRHPTFQTPTHPPPSRGTLAWKVLGVLSRAPNEPFNVRLFAKLYNAGRRGGVYSSLDSLESCGFVERDYRVLHNGERQLVPGSTRITQLGLKFLESAPVSAPVQGGCRQRPGSLSTHSVQFFLNIDDASAFTHVRLERVWPGLVLDPVQMPNYTQYRVQGPDFSLTIHTRKVVLQFSEVIDKKGVPLAAIDAQLVAKAASFVPLLKNTGISCSSVVLQSAHYARVGSWLAASLEKLDGRYFLELQDGSKLWIDRSAGPVELESDNPENIGITDRFLRELLEGKRSWNDVLSGLDSDKDKIDRLADLSASILRLHVEAHFKDLACMLDSVPPIDQRRLVDYVG